MSNDKTEVLPTTPAVPTRRSILRAASAQIGRPASTFAGWRDQCPTEELPAVRRERGRAAARRAGRRSHLRAALAGLALAAILLGALQLLALDGIAQARQAALAERAAAASQASPTEQAEAPAPQWVIEGTTTAAPSPLDLPRCTTSPDTPMPCLAHVSADSRRAVVLEEDASLTALVRR